MIQAKSPVVQLLCWHEEAVLMAAEQQLDLLIKILAVICDGTVGSALSSHFPATSNVEQVAHAGEMLNFQLWSLWELLILSSWGKSTYCYTEDQS